jgi:hypothetical protein
MPLFTAVQLISLYNHYDGGALSAVAVPRILEVYSHVSVDDIRRLHMDAQEHSSIEGELVMKKYLEEYSEPAPRPPYIDDFSGIEDVIAGLGEWKSLAKGENLTPEEVGEGLTEGLEDNGIPLAEREENIKLIAERYRQASASEKRQMVRPLIEQKVGEAMRESDDLFRLFGPSFPVIGMDLTEDTECTQWTFWFRRSCDQCSQTILRKQYAVRRPMMDGGWVGCYCSWNCVEDNILMRTTVDVEEAIMKEKKEPASTVPKDINETFEEKLETQPEATTEREGRKEKKGPENEEEREVGEEHQEDEGGCLRVNVDDNAEQTSNDYVFQVQPQFVDAPKNLVKVGALTPKEGKTIKEILEDEYSAVEVVPLLLAREFKAQCERIGIQDLSSPEDMDVIDEKEDEEKEKAMKERELPPKEDIDDDIAFDMA